MLVILKTVQVLFSQDHHFVNPVNMSKFKLENSPNTFLRMFATFQFGVTMFYFCG